MAAYMQFQCVGDKNGITRASRLARLAESVSSDLKLGDTASTYKVKSNQGRHLMSNSGLYTHVNKGTHQPHIYTPKKNFKISDKNYVSISDV